MYCGLTFKCLLSVEAGVFSSWADGSWKLYGETD